MTGPVFTGDMTCEFVESDRPGALAGRIIGPSRPSQPKAQEVGASGIFSFLGRFFYLACVFSSFFFRFLKTWSCLGCVHFN